MTSCSSLPTTAAHRHGPCRMDVSCLQEGKADYEIPYYYPNNISTMKGLALLASMERIAMESIIRVIPTVCGVRRFFTKKPGFDHRIGHFLAMQHDSGASHASALRC